MKLEEQLLSRFTCDHCQFRWSMVKLKFRPQQVICCPACKRENTITAIDATGNVNYVQRKRKARVIHIKRP